jgi:hypothetical protein
VADHVLATHIDLHLPAEHNRCMGTDPVASAFARWTEAHKKHVEAQKRLATAQKIAGAMGVLPPQELFDEVERLRAQAERLLTDAQQAMRAAGGA